MHTNDYNKEIDKLKEGLAAGNHVDARRMKSFFRTDLVWTSNAVEGNTVNRDEAQTILDGGTLFPGHSDTEIQETKGGAAALDYLWEDPIALPINEETIKTLHRLFAEAQPEMHPGNYRDADVIIVGATHTPPSFEQVPRLMKSLIQWVDASREKYHPVDFATALHTEFVSIHPFLDGNGRVARLLLNLSLLKDGYLPICIPPIRKMEYCHDIDKYAGGDRSPLRAFMGEMELMSLTDYARMCKMT